MRKRTIYPRIVGGPEKKPPLKDMERGMLRGLEAKAVTEKMGKAEREVTGKEAREQDALTVEVPIMHESAPLKGKVKVQLTA